MMLRDSEHLVDYIYWGAQTLNQVRAQIHPVDIAFNIGANAGRYQLA